MKLSVRYLHPASESSPSPIAMPPPVRSVAPIPTRKRKPIK